MDSKRKPYGITASFVNVGFAAGTTTTYSTTAASQASIGGLYGTQLGVQTNAASPTTDVNTAAAFVALAANKGSVFVFGINAAGTAQVAQGSVETLTGGTGNTAGSFVNAPQFPNLPDNFVPLGYVVVKAAPNAAAWTYGSSNWTATAISTSFKSVSTLPDRPQIA